MRELGAGAITLFGLVIGLTIVAVILSQRGQAPQVIQAVGAALSGLIGRAVNV